MTAVQMTSGQESTATSLDGSTVLVLGGAGGVGEGITRSLLRRGATVVATSRSEAKLAGLSEVLSEERAGTLVTRALDILDGDVAALTAELADAHGRLRGAVIAVGDAGAAGRQTILGTAEETWEAVVRGNLTSQFRAVKALLPLLEPDGALVNVTGMSAEVPFPGMAAIGATSAASKSLSRTLAAELAGHGPRVYTLVLGYVRTRPRRAAGSDSPDWYSAEEVGAHIASLVAGTGPLVDEPLHYLVAPALGVRTAPPDLP